MNNVTPIFKKRSLLMLERMILESLAAHCRSIAEIALDTGLKQELAAQVVTGLVHEGFLTFKEGRYELSKSYVKNFNERYTNSQDQLEELRELFISMVNSSFAGSSQIKLRKVALTKAEKAILGSYFINLEAFIKSVSDQNRRERKVCPTKDQCVFIWGEASYLDLAMESLQTI